MPTGRRNHTERLAQRRLEMEQEWLANRQATIAQAIAEAQAMGDVPVEIIGVAEPPSPMRGGRVNTRTTDGTTLWPLPADWHALPYRFSVSTTGSTGVDPAYAEEMAAHRQRAAEDRRQEDLLNRRRRELLHRARALRSYRMGTTDTKTEMEANALTLFEVERTQGLVPGVPAQPAHPATHTHTWEEIGGTFGVRHPMVSLRCTDCGHRIDLPRSEWDRSSRLGVVLDGYPL